MQKGKTVVASMGLVVTLVGKQYSVDVTFTDFRTAGDQQLVNRLRVDGAAARRAE